MVYASQTKKSISKGFTLIELLVTSALMLLVFGGLLASVQYTLRVISNTKATTSALALANEKIEYIRSLSYADVGTTAGIPNGVILENSTTSLNGVTLYERVLIQYIDSPDDGFGASDSNGIMADYKEVKVEYSWAGMQGTSTIFLLTDIVPPGIESTMGGGTLTVNVFDSQVQPVLGAEVHIINNTTTTTINTSRFTNASGVAMFSGAPAAANYHITVSKAGYSTDKTYVATTSNPTPITSPVAVVESAVSTMNFQIDELSDLEVKTVAPSVHGNFIDTFDDSSLVHSFVNTEVSGGSLVLSGGIGSYAPSGSVLSVSTTPSTITSWENAEWHSLAPSGTSQIFHMYYIPTGTSTYALIPDSDLPGNSVGFVVSPINLSSLSVSTYASLMLVAEFTTSDASTTPSIQDWEINYVMSEASIGNIPFTLTGNKIIGSTPVYKYQENHVTDGGGSVEINNLEWDVYSVILGTGSYDISNACASLPYILNPGVHEVLKLTLVPSVAFSLRVTVVDIDGNTIPSASVTLSRSGFSNEKITTSCGQSFFNTGLGSNSDYILTLHATGYVSQTISDVVVDGSNVQTVTLTRI